MDYCYYACGENVEEVKFALREDAWDYVSTHSGYDAVVESLNLVK